MKRNVYIHVPYPMIFNYLDVIEKEKINIELYLNGNDIDSGPEKGLEELNHILQANNLICTVHGPFYDLNPGGIDAKIRQLTLERFLALIDLVKFLQPQVVVLHFGYEEMKYGDIQETWLENSKNTWSKVLKHAIRYDIKIALENTFETTPDMLSGFLKDISSPNLGHCFDIGHFNMLVKTSMEDWFSKFNNLIFETHLHDNHGEFDEHLAIGKGNIDFKRFFSLLKKTNSNPELVIEAHCEEDARISLAKIGAFLKD